MTFNPIEAFRILFKSWDFLLISLIISLSAALYQRLSGPTHPKRISIPVGDKEFIFRTLRSQETSSPAAIEIPSALQDQNPVLSYRRFPTNDDWTTVSFSSYDNNPKNIVAHIPIQPAAGKVEYQIFIKEKKYPDQPVRLRYKDPVPLAILVPHIYSMFAALMFGAWAFLEGLFISKRENKMALPTAVQLSTSFFILGGFILGPFVQKNAFGEYWTGFPFGDDFTDNKVLFSIIFWLVAFFLNLKKPHVKSAVLAAVIMFTMYLIPHSFGGSQFDYSENKVKTGLQK